MINSTKNRIMLTCSFAATALSAALTCHAAIPNVSEAKLFAIASHVVTGKVIRTYERTKQASGPVEKTYGVAEVSVSRVKKGSAIAAGDRIYVRYWRNRWVGDGKPEPGHYGHANIPSPDDVINVYVKGDRKTGFDVIQPNGFFKAK